jgi:hypothetical protein
LFLFTASRSYSIAKKADTKMEDGEDMADIEEFDASDFDVDDSTSYTLATS